MKYLLILFPFISFAQLDTVMYNGEGRINILFLGDGYREGESNLFVSDVISGTEYMFQVTPFKEYRDYFNVFYSICHSNESGASHPGTYSNISNAGYESSCEDTPLHDVSIDTFYVETYDENLNQFIQTTIIDTVFVPVDNCFGSRFDVGVHRCIAPDGALLWPYVDSVANNMNVEVITIVNTQNDSHGGCAGGSGACSSRGSNGTIVHEFGHSFGGLADEYWEVLRSCYGGEAINRTSEYYTSLIPNTITTTKWINWMDGTSDIGFKQHLGGTDSNNDEIFTSNPTPTIQDICDVDNDNNDEEPFLDSDLDLDGILNIYSDTGDGDENMDNDGFNNYPDDGTIYNVNNFLFYYIDDLDNDGIPTYDENGNILDLDIDGDGCNNENDFDVDNDGCNNENDYDIDDDGIPNNQDEDIDGDGIYEDIDNDGIPNYEDEDVDGDNILNFEDEDIDGDGIYEDIDNDGIPNYADEDIDGDNILNNDDEDIDGDGIFDENENCISSCNEDDITPYGLNCISSCNEDDITPYGLNCISSCNNDDEDIDGDGVPNWNDNDPNGDDDIDGDGILNNIDEDVDGDGVLNLDCDGNILDDDYNNDNDDDNDGVLDQFDLNLNLDNDIDNDGIQNMDYSVLNTNNDPNVEVCEDYLWYRPSPNGCMMGSGGDNSGFCSICIEELIEVIHDKTNPINNYYYSYQNSMGENVVLNETSLNFSDQEQSYFPYTFTTDLIQNSPNTLNISWEINGLEINEIINTNNFSSSVNINLSDLNYGENILTVCVEDTTNLLRIDSHQEENHPHSNAAPSFFNHNHSSHLFCQSWEINNTISIGCMDPLACNYYPDATTNYGCQYLVDECGVCGGEGLSFSPPESYYDCNGNCLNDEDQDDICDELEIYGCTDLNACNYDSIATENNNSCEYPLNYPSNLYNCQGECILDVDNDGICNELDNCPENYNPNQENSNEEGFGDACLCNLLTLVPVNENWTGFTVGEPQSFYITTSSGDYLNNLIPSFNINEPYDSDNKLWEKTYTFNDDGPDILELTFFSSDYVILNIHFLSNVFENPCIVSQEFDIWTIGLNEESYLNKKELVKICDVLGREIKKTRKNQAFFHIYNDGSVEKKYFTE